MTDYVKGIACLYTIQEVAKILHCSKEKVYRIMRAGELKPVKVLGKSLFTPESVKAYLKKCGA